MAERKINSEMSRKLTLLINFQIFRDKKTRLPHGNRALNHISLLQLYLIFFCRL